MIAFLSGLMGRMTPVLLAVLLGIAVFSGMLARQYAVERDEAELRAEMEARQVEALGEVMDWQRDRMRALTAAIERRDMQLAHDRQAIDQQRATAIRLEQDDEQTAAWADQPVPDAAVGWLRSLDELPTPAAGDTLPRAAGEPGDTADGTVPSGNPQP